jgi:predicted nucleotidyltransferase
MRTLTERYDEILGRVVAELRVVYGARLVACAVYGSVGRGTMREDSDIDLLIVARDLPRGVSARRAEIDPVEERLDALLAPRPAGAARIVLSAVIRTPDEMAAGDPLFLDMVDDARLLHDPEGFLARYLDGLRARLRRLGARRVPWKGAWYWDVKPDYRPGEVFEWP